MKKVFYFYGINGVAFIHPAGGRGGSGPSGRGTHSD